MLFFDFFLCLTDSIIALDFMGCLFPAKLRPILLRGGLLIAAAALLSWTASFAPAWAALFLALALWFALARLLLDAPWQQQLLLSLFAMGLSALSEFAAAYLLSFFLGTSISQALEKEYGFFVIAAVSRLLFFALTEIARLGLSRSRPSKERRGFQPVLLFPASSVAVLYFAYYADPWLPQNSWYSFLSAAVCVLLIVSNLAFFGLWHRRQREEADRLAAAAARRSLEEQEKIIALQNRYLEELAALAHDHKNHLLAIRGLLREGENPPLEEYLRRISGTLAERRQEARRYTSNGAVNGILAAKGEECRLRGIPFMVQAEGGTLDFLDYGDACAIFGNALDNALEACEALPPGEKGFIRVAVSRQRELLSILFENSRALSQEITPGKDGLPATTKGEGPYHGYGLGNLKRAVEHYQGALLWEAPPGLFRLKILLSIPPVGE